MTETTEQRRRPGVATVFVVLTAALALVTLSARLGRWYWAADLLALFHDVYLVAALALLVGLLSFRRWTWAGVAALTLLVNGGLLAPYLPVERVRAADDRFDLRLYVHNLYYANDNVDAVLRDIEEHDPDVLFFMEYSHEMGAGLEPYLTPYPYRLIEPSRRTMGLALYSRVPFRDAESLRFPDTRIPIFRVTFEVGGEALHFVGAHPWPPIGRWGPLHRAQMADITEVAAATPHPLVVAGDFNASPWSFAVGRLEHRADLRDAQHGFGFRKTWYLGPVPMLPLDHVLVSDEIKVSAFRHGDRGGSDHVPLILDLTVDRNINATTTSSVGSR
ncbi:MAG: endonuclease/exonuclease/phosphatase family protein [Trueperaceae bacterium]|nr:endonuclease/exonuclease/phosphatase family protein [Trueperaceae bacterium]